MGAAVVAALSFTAAAAGVSWPAGWARRFDIAAYRAHRPFRVVETACAAARGIPGMFACYLLFTDTAHPGSTVCAEAVLDPTLTGTPDHQIVEGAVINCDRWPGGNPAAAA